MTTIACLVPLSVCQRLSALLLAQAYKSVMITESSNPKLSNGALSWHLACSVIVVALQLFVILLPLFDCSLMQLVLPWQ